MTTRVLLVDDEEDIRLVLSITLKDMGYQVETAENGREALRLFKENPAEIVITDIKMPDIDGIELLRRIKNQNPETEVIMITGHGDMDSAILSFQYEAADFITKPINVDALEIALRRVNENRAKRRSLMDYTTGLEALVHQKVLRLAETEKILRMETSPERVEDLQRRLGYLYDELPCFFFIRDAEFHLTAVNRVFQEHFGQSIGVFCYEAARGLTAPCPDCPGIRTMETGLPQQAELEFVSPQGKKTGVMVLTSPIRDREGRVTHVAVMATDLTRILQVQDRLSHLGLVIGSLSHGIKGLLTGMDAGLYYLETGLAKGDTHLVDQGLSVVRLSLGRIRSMVLDILMFSKDRPMAAETVRLQTFAQHLADEIRLRLAPHGLEFRVDIEAGDQDIQIDAGLIRAALMNLFDNAVDACLSDKFKPNHFIRFTVRPRENGASFEIEDNGVGMDEETRSKVFAMFFSSKGSKGTGLGLFVTRQIVDQHHGRIEMDATLGKGARFRVLL